MCRVEHVACSGELRLNNHRSLLAKLLSVEARPSFDFFWTAIIELVVFAIYLKVDRQESKI
jgi:hypothetical protein